MPRKGLIVVDRIDEALPDVPEEADESADHEALKVPKDTFEDFLDRMRPGRICSFCSSGEYQVAPAPTGGTAGVVATPVPNLAKIGVWFFAASCDFCGDTRFFHTGISLKAMERDHS